MAVELTIPTPYFRPFYRSKKHRVICDTPRTSGKSYAISTLIALQACRYPGRDIVVFRANANSLKDSVANDVIEKFGIIGKKIDIKSAPIRIEVDGGETIIYFIGVSGYDTSRVRGFHPKHNKLSMIVGDECQQITSEQNLAHALSSLRRYIDTTIDYKTVLCGNPHEIKGHWWNTYCLARKSESSYEYVKATYRDIYALLNEEDKEEIAIMERVSPALYRFMYLGDLSGINGGAYPAFNRERHLLSQEQAVEKFSGENIWMLIIGGDGAITHDMTCLNCIAVMTDGRAVVLEPFIFNPLSYGRALAPSELSELIYRYFDDLEEKYQITANGIPVYITIDCASEDLITQIRYNLRYDWTVNAFTTKNVIRNTATANNVFARDMCYIVNYGGNKDYATGEWVTRDVPLLVDQLESVVWKASKLDPAVPNDCSDSFVYGICTYYENPDNLNLPGGIRYGRP